MYSNILFQTCTKLTWNQTLDQKSDVSILVVSFGEGGRVLWKFIPENDVNS